MSNTSKTRTKIRKGGGSSIRELPPDDPIFTRGFVFGGRRTKASFPSTKPSSSDNSKQPAQDAVPDVEK